MKSVTCLPTVTRKTDVVIFPSHRSKNSTNDRLICKNSGLDELPLIAELISSLEGLQVVLNKISSQTRFFRVRSRCTL